DFAYDAENVHGATGLKSGANPPSNPAPVTPTPTPTPPPPATGAGGVSQSGSKITMTGLPTAANTFDVKMVGGKISATLNGKTSSFSNASNITLKIVGGTGIDKVTIADNVTAKALIDVGAGNDSVRGGGGGDTIYAGAGNDTVDGGPGT